MMKHPENGDPESVALQREKGVEEARETLGTVI